MKFVLISFICLALFTCRSTDLTNWPSEIPDQRYFEASYEADSVNQALQTRQEYLSWILSFYEGTLIEPTGWSEMQALVVASAMPAQRNELDKNLAELGGQIAAEWAKENRGRLIDSRMLSIWASVLQLVEGPEQQFAAIQLINADVEGLLQRQIQGAEINDGRYEQRLDLQLFGDF